MVIVKYEYSKCFKHLLAWQATNERQAVYSCRLQLLHTLLAYENRSFTLVCL